MGYTLVVLAMLLTELSRISGCPASTIHYYRRLRLLQPPVVGVGYGELHLGRLRRIDELKSDRGLTLRQIADELPGPGVEEAGPKIRLAVAAAELFLTAGPGGPSMDELARALRVGKDTLRAA